MPRDLNSRQMQFASSVAAGKPLAVAYREAYKPANDKAPSVYQNAKRSAKHPGIAARIKELQLELLPAPSDLKAIYDHGLATMIQLSNSCEDDGVRWKAARWLCEEAERQAEKQRALEATKVPERRRESDAEIVAELRMLYAKAFGKRQPELLETVNDWAADGQSGEAPAENLPQVAGPLAEVAAGSGPVCGEAEAPEPGHPATVEVSLVAEKLNPAVQFRMERIPGYFPARYRRVPIEP
jgi:hypothetical protein